VHPTLREDGSLDVGVELPRPGVYQLIADFLPAGGSPQLLQKSIVTAGYTGPLVAVPVLPRDTADKVLGDTRVKLTMPDPIAGREQLVTFDLEDASTGAAVVDLQPYLGAAGHLLLVSADLAIAAHSHPVAEISKAGGPTVVFQMIFPRAGDYRMWVQFQRHGEVLTSSFTVPVKADLPKIRTLIGIELPPGRRCIPPVMLLVAYIPRYARLRLAGRAPRRPR
jgi:hypothetical protein